MKAHRVKKMKKIQKNKKEELFMFQRDFEDLVLSEKNTETLNN